MPAESVTVVHSDTDVTPYDMATLGSRSLFHMGNAVKLAARGRAARSCTRCAKRAAACRRLRRSPDIFKKKYGMQAGNVVGTGSYIPTYKSPDAERPDRQRDAVLDGRRRPASRSRWTPRPARVRITRLVNVADVGTPINPKIVETQLSGAAIMQLGFTLFEKMEFDAQGQLRNASLAEYKIPGMLDLPREHGERGGGGRADAAGRSARKGVGETGTFGVSPAIANAIHDAVGVRLTALPLTPEAVCMAMKLK